MKTTKWIIIIALLCFKTISYSQNFINDNKEWAIISSFSTYNENQKWTTYYKFIGDTVINNFSYNKLYKSTDTNQVNWSLHNPPFWWERNDSVFLRVYGGGCAGKYLNDTTTLVYDFNLLEGDTFNNFGVDTFNNAKVDSIRYFAWGGSIRKHWYFGFLNSGFVISHWVEGVGSLQNFIFPTICYNSLAEELLCFHENGNLIYQNPNYTDCYVYTNVPAITKSNEHINLFPNPATTKLKFIIPENETNITYTIYNLQGVVQLLGNNNKTETELNVSSLQRGLYFLKIKTNKKTIIKKIILQ